MSQPETSAQATERVLGGDWPLDTDTYDWVATNRRTGEQVPLSFRYHANGGVLTTPTGDLAIKDARSF